MHILSPSHLFLSFSLFSLIHYSSTAAALKPGACPPLSPPPPLLMSALTFPSFTSGCCSPLTSPLYAHIFNIHITILLLFHYYVRLHVCPSASACLIFSFNVFIRHVRVRALSHPLNNDNADKQAYSVSLPAHIHPCTCWRLVASVTWPHRGDTPSVTLTAGISQRSTNYGTHNSDKIER